MRWRLILEEYNPGLIGIQVDTNNPIKPDMLSLIEHFS